MSDPTSTAPTKTSETSATCPATERAKVVGWTAGVTVFFSAVALINSPTWPVAVGMGIVSTTVALVCCSLMKRG